MSQSDQKRGNPNIFKRNERSFCAVMLAWSKDTKVTRTKVLKILAFPRLTWHGSAPLFSNAKILTTYGERFGKSSLSVREG